MRRRHRAVRRALAAAGGLAVAAALTGCTPTVVLSPAPQATTAACAGVIVRVASESLGALQPRTVDAQGTAAWGDPLAVTLYCGVGESPSADQCFAYDGVDWKITERTIAARSYEVVTTVGRAPIVQLVIDPRYGNAQSEVLQPVSDAVKAATARSGIGCTLASTPTATP